MVALNFKRLSSAIFLLSILAGSASAAHFTLSPHSNKGNMTVFFDTVIHPTINGMPMGKGDEIAVFDTLDSCYGDVRWDSVLNQSMSVWANDPQASPGKKDGFVDGEKLRFKVWDSSASLLVPIVTAPFYPAGVPTPPPINLSPFSGSTYSLNGLSILSGLSALSIPAAPPLTAPTNNAQNQLVSLGLSWGTTAFATSYEVQLSLSSAFNTTILDQSGAALTGVTASSLANSTTYYWHVSASNTSGTTWSNVWSFTTVIAPPTAPVLALPTNNAQNRLISLSLSWGTSATAASYEVQLSLSTAFNTTVLDQSGATLTSVAANSLANSTTYYWRANASNIGGTAWSGIWSFTTIVATPAAPLLALPTNNAQNQLTTLGLSWGTSALATSYEVQVSLSTAFNTTVLDQSGAALTSATASSLLNSTTYYWRANASNVGGTSWSSVWSFTTIVAAPTAPLLATPTNNAQNQLTTLGLSWGTSALATSYEVQVSLSTAFNTTVLDQSGAALKSSPLSGLANSTTYYWRANASNIGGTTWSGIWSFTTIVAAPNAPILATPTNNAQAQSVSLGLSWSTSALATSYEVQVSLSSGFGTTFLDQSGATLTSATASGLAYSTTYYWRANASNVGGTAWSDVWSFTTNIAPPDAPLLSSPTNGIVGVATTLTLSWGSSALATSYEVQVSLSTTFNTTITDQSGAALTSATVTGLSNSGTYYWRANASNAGGTSWSSIWSFSTLVRRVIPMAAGWNMKSLNIHPTDSTVGAIFSGRTGTITDPKGFLLVKDVYGAQYMPSFGINSIGNFVTGSGYQIYTDSADNITATGTPIALASTSISLPTGNWDIIAFLPQANMQTIAVFAGIASKVVLVKDNSGAVYMPGLFNSLDSLRIGEGYYVYTTAAASLTYPGSSKQLAGEKPLLSLPNPRHYAKHRITGNNATLVAKRVDFGGKPASDNFEVGAFDATGNLVGAGTVLSGLTVVTIWGNDPQTKAKDGCDIAEKVSFRLWDGTKEYPLDATGGDQTYDVNKILFTSLVVPSRAFITSFALSHVYPNPFRGSVHIAFDVPAIGNASDQAVEIGVYDMRGSLVQSIAKGRYAPGSYAVSWNGRLSNNTATGSSIYIIRMKANGFDKRLKLIELK